MVTYETSSDECSTDEDDHEQDDEFVPREVESEVEDNVETMNTDDDNTTPDISSAESDEESPPLPSQTVSISRSYKLQALVYSPRCRCNVMCAFNLITIWACRNILRH